MAVPFEEIRDVGDLRRYVKDRGSHWFDPDSMRFFSSRVGSRIEHKGGFIYFVSSEQFNYKSPRLYTVRKVCREGGIDTVGNFQGYRTGKEAWKAIQENDDEKGND